MKTAEDPGHLRDRDVVLSVEDVTKVYEKRRGLNYGSNKVRYLTPVKVGSRLRARASLGAFEPIAGGAQLVWNTTVDIEGEDRPACIAETITRAYR